MVKSLVLVSLLGAAPAWGAAAPPTPPVRPTYRDVSLKVSAAAPSYPYKWFRGHTATQVERDAMQETLAAVAVPEAIRYARTMSSCAGAMRTALSNLSKITSKLGPEYEGNTLFNGGRWFIPTSGRHYHDEEYALRAIRRCSLGGGAKACAQNPLMTPDLLDLLDLRVDDGRCVAGATFELLTPTETYDPKRGGLGAIQTSQAVPVPKSRQMGLLHDTMAAHQAVSDFRCGVGPAPAPGSVTAAHVAFEATATTEKQHHFFRMKAFAGYTDPGWSPADVCRWARLQDRAHERWMQAVMGGDWEHSREAENDHQLAHVCMNLRDPRLLVRFSCAPGRISSCPVRTCDEVLAGLP